MATLDVNQQRLVNNLKLAHQTLALARKLRSTELARRLQANELRARQDYERDLAESVERIRMDLDAEVAAHASAQDEMIIACYNDGIPIRKMALEGFGNQYDGGVQGLIAKLRADGRLGAREGFHRNTTDYEDLEVNVAFPSAVNAEAIAEEHMTLGGPEFTYLGEITLVDPTVPGGDDGIYAKGVTLTLDPRDPWFKEAKKSIRPGSKFATARSTILYRHPGTHKIVSLDSEETGLTMIDHPVARYAKEHPEEVEVGFETALNA